MNTDAEPKSGIISGTSGVNFNLRILVQDRVTTLHHVRANIALNAERDFPCVRDSVKGWIFAVSRFFALRHVRVANLPDT